MYGVLKVIDKLQQMEILLDASEEINLDSSSTSSTPPSPPLLLIFSSICLDKADMSCVCIWSRGAGGYQKAIQCHVGASS